MSKTYKCSTCGVVTTRNGHLCSSVALNRASDFCGCGQQVSNETGRVCEEEIARLRFECRSCGRKSESADLVCAPSKVDS